MRSSADKDPDAFGPYHQLHALPWSVRTLYMPFKRCIDAASVNALITNALDTTAVRALTSSLLQTIDGEMLSTTYKAPALTFKKPCASTLCSILNHFHTIYLPQQKL